VASAIEIPAVVESTGNTGPVDKPLKWHCVLRAGVNQNGQLVTHHFYIAAMHVQPRDPTVLVWVLTPSDDYPNDLPLITEIAGTDYRGGDA